MQLYTKQQLEGSVRFSPHCLVGNWNEDTELHRTILKDFLAKKETGSLKLDKFQQRMSVALGEVELTKIRNDPYVHFGDLVQLQHIESGAVLACDVEDKDMRPGEHSCSGTATTELKAPCARNTFLLAKYRPNRIAPTETVYEDDVLHYGQKVRLLANPMVLGEPLDASGGRQPVCLFSRPTTTTHYAKYSRHQYAGFTLRHNYDTVWLVATPDPTERLASQGVEVMAGAPILLVHCSTNKPLCLEPNKYPNDFGQELEVSVHQAAPANLHLAMENMTMGYTKGNMPKVESTQNYWMLLTGTTVASLPAAEVSGLQIHELLMHVMEQLEKGTVGLAGLEKKLITLSDRNGSLKGDELMAIVRQLGLSISGQAVHELCSFFAADLPDAVNTKALLQALKSL